MDVVRKIHDAPAVANADVSYLKGQMIGQTREDSEAKPELRQRSLRNGQTPEAVLVIVRHKRAVQRSKSPMADNNRNPQQQQNDPARQAPSQQQQQGQPRQDEHGRNPGGQG
jgi:hypothetical protein